MILARLMTRLRRDRRGLALIEFAFAAPVLALLFVGGYQLMDAISAYRKATTTDRALADLMTRNTSTTVLGAQNVMAAAKQILAPYPTSNAVTRLTQVKIDLLGQSTVDWSVSSTNATPYHQGDAIAVPTAMNVAGTYLILAEVNYSYVPHIASTMLGTIPLKNRIFMSPRNSSAVPCSDCSS